MAKNLIYAIYDESCEAFIQFYPCINEKLARLQFEKAYKDKRLNIPFLYDYPNLFKIYQVAIFDDNTGIFDNLPQHKPLFDFASLNIPSSDVAEI